MVGEWIFGTDNIIMDCEFINLTNEPKHVGSRNTLQASVITESIGDDCFVRCARIDAPLGNAVFVSPGEHVTVAVQSNHVFYKKPKQRGFQSDFEQHKQYLDRLQVKQQA